MSTLIKSNNKWLKVAGGGVLPVVRKPAWSQAETISALPFTAPTDGIIVGFTTTPNNNVTQYVYINSVKVALSRRASDSNDHRTADVQCIVNRGDILTADYTYTPGSETSMSFVPFEDSTIAEPGGTSENTVIKSYVQVEYNLASGEPTNIAAFSPTGWFTTDLKVNAAKVAVILRHQHCIDSNEAYVFPVVAYNVSNDADGNLMFQFINTSGVAKECVKCRVWFWLIGKPDDMPSN